MLLNLDTRKGISVGILFAFLVNSTVPVTWAQAQLASSTVEELHLPTPGTMVALSPEFDPPILKGIKIHPDNPLQFDFILDQGDDDQGREEQLKPEATKLIKYFLASLTIPEKDLWVNLSPYEKNRIIPGSFGRTEMGRDLLAEDYMLKQITASLIYPEGDTGRKFWKRIYQEAAKRYGTTDVPVNTFNKVWIIPQKAVVYENAKAGTAYVVESQLKVMLEEDYLALSKNSGTDDVKGTNALGSNIEREIVIPELTKEVNEGKNFAQLRQVYNSLILATWYKKKIKDSILSKVYADKNKTQGVGYKNINVEDIYQRYLQAFKKGVYNYIKEDLDPLTQQPIPRKYFSGGLDLALTGATTVNASGAFKTVEELPDASMFASLRRKFRDIKVNLSATMSNIITRPQRTMNVVPALDHLHKLIDQREDTIDTLMKTQTSFTDRVKRLNDWAYKKFQMPTRERSFYDLKDFKGIIDQRMDIENNAQQIAFPNFYLYGDYLLQAAQDLPAQKILTEREQRRLLMMALDNYLFNLLSVLTVNVIQQGGSIDILSQPLAVLQSATHERFVDNVYGLLYYATGEYSTSGSYATLMEDIQRTFTTEQLREFSLVSVKLTASHMRGLWHLPEFSIYQKDKQYLRLNNYIDYFWLTFHLETLFDWFGTSTGETREKIAEAILQGLSADPVMVTWGTKEFAGFMKETNDELVVGARSQWARIFNPLVRQYVQLRDKNLAQLLPMIQAHDPKLQGYAPLGFNITFMGTVMQLKFLASLEEPLAQDVPIDAYFSSHQGPEGIKLGSIEKFPVLSVQYRKILVHNLPPDVRHYWKNFMRYSSADASEDFAVTKAAIEQRISAGDRAMEAKAYANLQADFLYQQIFDKPWHDGDKIPEQVNEAIFSLLPKEFVFGKARASERALEIFRPENMVHSNNLEVTDPHKLTWGASLAGLEFFGPGFSINLIPHGAALVIGLGRMDTFPEARAEYPDMLKESHSVLRWWMKHELEGFARKLGFRFVQFNNVTNYPTDALSADGYNRVDDNQYLKDLTTPEVKKEPGNQTVDNKRNQSIALANEIEDRIIEQLDIPPEKLYRSVVDVDGNAIPVTQYKNSPDEFVKYLKVGQFIILNDSIAWQLKDNVLQYPFLIRLSTNMSIPTANWTLGLDYYDKHSWSGYLIGVLAGMVAKKDQIIGASFIDAGAGVSGICSIVARKLGAAEIIVIEHDPNKKEELENNLKQNGVADYQFYEQSFKDIAHIPVQHPAVISLDLPFYGTQEGELEIVLSLVPDVRLAFISGGPEDMEGFLVKMAKLVERVFNSTGRQITVTKLLKNDQKTAYNTLMAVKNEINDISDDAELPGPGKVNKRQSLNGLHQGFIIKGKDSRVKQATGLVENGGIDLTPAHLNVQTQNAQGQIKFQMDQAMLTQLQNSSGFVPVIVNIQPVTNIKVFLGLDSDQPAQRVASL